jgi:hypothetical protein
MSDQACCGFCAEYANQADLFFLAVWPPGAEDGERSQQMYCHGACLDKALHPLFPRHPDLLEVPQDD